MAGINIGAVQQTAGNLLNTISTNIGNAASSLTSLLSPQQAASLSLSLFSAGPQDRLIVQDIYGIQSGNPINAIDQLIGSRNQNVIAAFRASSGGIGNLTGLITASALGVSLNPATLASRVQNAVTNFSGTYRTLPGSTTTAAVQSRVLSANQYPTISTTVNGAVSSVNTTNLRGAQDLITTVNAVTGNSSLASYMDVGAASALMAVIIQEAIALGIAGVVEALVASATNDEVARNALQANAAYAVQQCDLGTINTIVAALGSGYISSQVPHASAHMLATYKFPVGSTPAQYDSLYASLDATLSAVDPHWGTAYRAGKPISDLTPFTFMSADARTLFSALQEYVVELAIAPVYPSVGLITQAKKQYPFMLVTAANSEYVVTNPHTA